MASSNIRVAFCFVRCPRHVTSRLWMNFILIELNMTCKAPHNLTPVFLFWCPYILLCNYLFIFLKIIPFWVLTFAFISPCAIAHVIFDFSIFMNWFMFPLFMFCLLISRSSFEFQTSLLVFVVQCDHESQNSTPSHSKIVSTKMLCLDNGMKK